MSIDSSVDGLLNGGGAPSAKFASVGDTVKGSVVSAESRQQTDLDGKAKTWDDGSPQMQIIITLDTDERDPSIIDDDGKRRVFVKGKMLTALKEALKDAGAKLEVGAKLAFQYTGDGTAAKAGYSPPKLYKVAYKAPEPAAVVGVDELL